MKKAILSLAITVTILSAGGCRKKPTNSNALYKNTFSPIYQEFDITSLVEPKMHARDHQKYGSWNTATLRGNNQYSAVLPVTEGSDTPQMILNKIDTFVKSKTQKARTEGLSPTHLKGTEKHTYTLFMYNWQDRHGELRVWLFPHPDGKHIGFAAHHYEEEFDNKRHVPRFGLGR